MPIKLRPRSAESRKKQKGGSLVLRTHLTQVRPNMNPSVSDGNGHTGTRNVERVRSTLDIFAAESAAHRENLSPTAQLGPALSGVSFNCSDDQTGQPV